jgi:hypothetical protein
MMTSTRTHSHPSRREQKVPSSLEEWLAKWEPRLSSFKKRKGSATAGKASEALDELEFLLTRTVENQLTE